MAKKKKSQATVLEAVDTLSHLVDLDVEKPEKTKWLDPAKVEENQETVRETFRTINTYLQHLYQKDRQELSHPQMQKGVRAMIELAGEAARKVDQYAELFPKTLKDTQGKEESISEFKKLQQFYLSKVFSKVSKASVEEDWEQEGGELNTDNERQVLQDLDTVRQDRDYELFYITHDDGTPFFTSNLLRHLRMVGNFDETFISSDEREDLLSQLETALDREFHLSAQKMVQECTDLIDLFYREALQHKDHDTLMQMNKAIMALFLAANPRNLRHNSKGKYATNYWSDFLYYFRLALQTESYQKWKEGKAESELDQNCLKLMHLMSHTLFLKARARDQDLEILHALIGKDLDSSKSIWASLADAELKLLQELRNYPSGPLMKTLKMFRQEEGKEGFNPLLQQNNAGQIFNITTEDLHTTVIHTPMPIHQTTLESAEIVPEFKEYLHALGERKHLYVNLQDRTSWKEQFRCKLLEKLSEQGEFSHAFHLITLPKDTDFYHQKHPYGDLDDAKQFCITCIDQVVSGKECGFYFPPGKTPKGWIEPLVKFVHDQFFENKPHLNRKERLDFIEILYFFIVLRYFDQEKPDVLNFSCKDGIDAGAAMAASFYGFTRMLSSAASWTSTDRDFFLFSLFLPALFIRRRSIDTARTQRAFSALEHFEAVLNKNRDQVLKNCVKILPEISLKNISITDVA